jgi:CRISPR system Cascade subunit CasD
VSTLLLRLAAPLQSWGRGSRFARRTTEPQPTKSGVIGLLAAALGRRRTDSLEDLLGLTFGARLDQPGHLQRDFHVARSLDGNTSMPLSERFYLADAVFLAAVEGEDELIQNLDDALRHPYFPLYLGRRSCPPVGPVTLGVRALLLREALRAEPWQASLRVRRRAPRQVSVEAVADAQPDDRATFISQDVPVSFDPQWRRYATRAVNRFTVDLDNLDGRSQPPSTDGGVGGHDPVDALGEP